MGWIWSSPSPAAPNSSEQNKPTSPPTLSTTQSPPPSPTSTSAPPPTRAELEEAELQSFLKDIDSDVTKPFTSTKYTRTSRSPTSQSQSPDSPPSNGDHKETIAESLLPTTMSCRAAFDAAFYCNSLGGRINDVYRHGTLTSCSESWGDFWFCMRTRTQSEPSKGLAIKEFYREKDRLRYGGKGMGGQRGSSEDVWESREEVLPKGSAFSREFEEFKGSDEEWREANRRWREGLKGE